MASLPLTFVLELAFLFIGFLLAFDESLTNDGLLISRFIGVACFIVEIPFWTGTQRIITLETGAAVTYTIDATTLSYVILLDVFFLFIAMLKVWFALGENPRFQALRSKA
jgi:hypothetical protein